MTLRSWTGLVSGVLALVFLHDDLTQPARAQSAPRYTLIDLGTLGGGSATPADVNDAGQVAGYSSSGTAGSRAFLWTAGHMAELATLGGTSSYGNGLNNLGDAVGLSSMPVGSGRAALWRAGAAPINLTPDLSNMIASTATAINDNGQVVIQFNAQVFVWENGARTPIGDLGLGSTHGFDINNAGQVVGSSYHPAMTPLGQMQHAFLWQGGVMTDLGVLPGDEDSGANAINSQGWVVGSSGRTDPETYESFYRPFIYKDGVMSAIPNPSFEAYAGGINDAGVVVGSMRAGGGVSAWSAWVHENGVTTNLNSLKPSGSGLHLAHAQGINNAGQITGVAYDAQFRAHAFLLTPCDPCGPAPVIPTIKINDVTLPEGKSGTTTFAFTVSLSEPTTATVAVNFITVNVSAIAGVDYNFANGTLLFGPGETAKTVNVAVRGDRSREPDESFNVRLSNADGATIFDGSGAGVIRNDDR